MRNTHFTPSRTRRPWALTPSSALRVTIAIAATLLAGCRSDSVVGAPRDQSPNRLGQAELSAAAIQPLWNELTPITGVLTGTASGGVIAPANDFVVPERAVWSVSTIVLRGVQVTGNPDATLSIAFRTNGVGQPGALIQRFTLAPVSKTVVDQTGQSDFRIDLPFPVTLGTGTYWLESQCIGFVIQCGLGPVVGQQAFTTLDGGVTWTPGFPNVVGPPADNLFALLGTADTPERRIADLRTTVASLGLDRGTQTKLDARLQLALVDLGAGDFAGACGAMRDFINLVNTKTSKKLTAGQAAALTDSATGIRTLIGC